MFPIKWNDAYRKKDGSLGTMENLGGGGTSELPEHSEADAGKVLGVDDEGGLAWEVIGGTKVYYKTWEKNFYTDMVIAKFSDNTASSSGIHIAKFNADNRGSDITINGYTPIGAIAIDTYTGYAYMVGIQQGGADARYGYQVTFAIGSTEIAKSGCKVKVFYVKNEDLEAMS